MEKGLQAEINLCPPPPEKKCSIVAGYIQKIVCLNYEYDKKNSSDAAGESGKAAPK